MPRKSNQTWWKPEGKRQRWKSTKSTIQTKPLKVNGVNTKTKQRVKFFLTVKMEEYTKHKLVKETGVYICPDPIENFKIR